MYTESTVPGLSADDPGDGAAQAVAAVYRAHAGGLVRLAVVILGDHAAAEDVVQDAFCGLYRRWGVLRDPAKALSYVRSAVVNGCRSVHRYQALRMGTKADEPVVDSAETMVLLSEEYRTVLAGMQLLPPRQREALALRYFADLTDREIAEAMGISRGTVKSTISRGSAALARYLGEEL